jgi:predicted lipoprotein with Yx(FWY)xxD motif
LTVVTAARGTAATLDRVARTVAATMLAMLAGCEIGTGCDAIAKPAVRVTVHDARTGAAIAAGTTIVVSDGAFRDSIVVTDRADVNGYPYGLAIERAGTYTVTVRKAGYEDWTRTGVRAERGRCNVATATLAVRLQPR